MPPLSVELAYPAAGATDIPISASVQVRFAERILPSSWSEGFRLIDPERVAAVPGTYTYNDAEKTGIFQPSRPLAYGHRYLLTLTTAIRSTQRVPLNADVGWFFTTEPAPDETAPSVDALPVGGLYRRSLEVRLLATEPSSILWTASETGPIGTPYSGPIPVGAGVTTLRFVATDAAGNASAERMERYVVDLMTPVTTIEPMAGLYGVPQTVHLRVADNSTSLGITEPPRIYYLVEDPPGMGPCPEVGPDGAIGSTLYRGPFLIDAAVGEERSVRVCVRAIDHAGNRETPQGHVFQIDRRSVFSRATPAGALFNAAQTVTLEVFKDAAHTIVDPDAAIFFTTDNTPVTFAPSQRYQAPITIAQTTTLRFRARDLAGNQEPERVEAYTIDTEPPTTVLGSSPTGMVQTGSFVLTLAVSDNLPGATGYYLLQEDPTGVCPDVLPGGANVQVYSQPIAIDVAEGTEKTLRVCFRAIDRAGNQEQVNQALFTIDSRTPVTTSSRRGGNYNAADCRVRTGTACAQAFCPVILSADDTDATVHYTLGGAAPVKCTGRCDVAVGHSDGAEIPLEFWSVDAAGNEEDHQTIVYRTDLCPPSAPSSLQFSRRARMTVVASADDEGAATKVYGYEIARWSAGETPTASTFDAHRVSTIDCAGGYPLPSRSVPPIVTPGSTQVLIVPGVEPGGSYQIAARAVDDYCNRSPMSDPVQRTFAFEVATLSATAAEPLGTAVAGVANLGGDTSPETGLPIGDLAVATRVEVAPGTTLPSLRVYRGRYNIGSLFQEGIRPTATPNQNLGPGLTRGNLLLGGTEEIIAGYTELGAGGLQAWRRTPDGSTFEPSPYVIATSQNCTAPGGLVVSNGDLNGDGRSELVLAQTNRACVFLSGVATNEVVLNGSVGVHFDIIGNVSDSQQDMGGLVFGSGSTLYLYPRIEAGGTNQPVSITNERTVAGVSRAGDFNGDGLADFALVEIVISSACPPALPDCGAFNYRPAIKVFFGNTSVSWAAADEVRSFSSRVLRPPTDQLTLVRLSSGDVDGDGLTDLAVAVAYYYPGTNTRVWQLGVLYGRRTGDSQRSTEIASDTGGPIVNRGPASMAVIGDITGDGLDDIALGFPDTSSSVKVLLLR